MSDETPVFDVGDSLSVYEVPVLDSLGRAVDLTGGTVKLFAKSRTNLNRVVTAGTPIVTITGWSFTVGNKVVTGVGASPALASRVINAAAPQGAWVTAVVAGVSFTMTDVALSSLAAQSVQFWPGVLMDISGPRATLGLPALQGLGSLLAPGNLLEDLYDDEVYYKSGSLEGVSSRAQFIGRRPL